MIDRPVRSPCPGITKSLPNRSQAVDQRPSPTCLGSEVSTTSGSTITSPVPADPDMGLRSPLGRFESDDGRQALQHADDHCGGPTYMKDELGVIHCVSCGKTWLYSDWVS